MTDTFDYQTICRQGRATPKSVRDTLNVGGIWSNMAKCLKCGDTIRSKNKHDYRSCSCGNLSVDGGSWYAKRIFRSADWEDLTESFDDVNTGEDHE